VDRVKIKSELKKAPVPVYFNPEDMGKVLSFEYLGELDHAVQKIVLKPFKILISAIVEKFNKLSEILSKSIDQEVQIVKALCDSEQSINDVIQSFKFAESASQKDTADKFREVERCLKDITQYKYNNHALISKTFLSLGAAESALLSEAVSHSIDNISLSLIEQLSGEVHSYDE
jgi:hypothetical protein